MEVTVKNNIIEFRYVIDGVRIKDSFDMDFFITNILKNGKTKK